jgi:hypothetical protein
MRGRRQETQKKKVQKKGKKKDKMKDKRRKQVTCELHSDAAKTWYQ